MALPPTTKGAPASKRKKRVFGRETWNQGFGIVFAASGPIVPFIERSTAERMAARAEANMLEYAKIILTTEVVQFHDYYGYRRTGSRPAPRP